MQRYQKSVKKDPKSDKNPILGWSTLWFSFPQLELKYMQITDNSTDQNESKYPFSMKCKETQ